MSIERRLRNHYRLTDLLPSEAAYGRSVALRVPAKQFMAQIRRLIAASLIVLPFADDAPSETDLTCPVRYRMNNYEIVISIAPEQHTASIKVRSLSITAPLVAFQVRAAQILAGLVEWAADQGLVARDFRTSELGRPERRDKDIGDWLPELAEWQAPAIDADAVLTPMSTWDGKYDIPRGRLLAAGVIGLGAFALLAWLDRPGFRVPGFIQVLPVVLVAGYLSAEMMRSMAPSQKTRRRTRTGSSGRTRMRSESDPQ